MTFAFVPGLALALLASQEVRRPVPLPEPAEIVAGTELRFYDASHLTGAARLAQLVEGIRPTADPVELEAVLARLDGLDERRKLVESTTTSLLAAIREMIAPPLADGVQRVDGLDGGRLALVGTPEQHAWLGGFLATATGFDGFIDVQARLFVLRQGRLAELSQARSGEVLTPARVEALLGKLRGLGVEAVTAPRLAALPFQQANLSVMDQVAYIKDYEIKVLPGESTEVVDPVVDVIQHGLQLRFRAAPLAGERLSVWAELEYSHLEQPIPAFTTKLGALQSPVVIQIPKLTKVNLDGRFDLSSGETLLLATVDPSGEREVLVLIRAVRLAPEHEADR